MCSSQQHISKEIFQHFQSTSWDCMPYLASRVPDRQIPLEVQRQTGDPLPLLGDSPGCWLRSFLRLLPNASQHPLGISAEYLDILLLCSFFPPPRSCCSQSALCQSQPESSSRWWGACRGSNTSKRKSLHSLLGRCMIIMGEPAWQD